MIRSILEGCIFAIILSIAAISFSAAVVIYVEKYSCEKYSEATGRETKYVGFQCYIKAEKDWYSESEYTALIATKGVE